MSDPVVPTWAAVWALVFLVPATVLVAVAAALIERVGPIRLGGWAEDAGPRLQALYATRRRFEAFRFLLSWSAKILPVLTMLALLLLLRGQAIRGAWWLAAGSVAVLLAGVEWACRGLVALDAENALERFTMPLSLARFVFSPLIWALGRWMPDADREADLEEPDEVDEVSENEIEAFIDVGRREGILEPEEEELVRSIVDFGDSFVKSVMTPRVEIKSASVDEPLEALAAHFFASKHARLPLFRGSIDHVVGILHIRDLFEALHETNNGGARVDAAGLAKLPFFVPESKPLRDLLSELQHLHQQMAIVVDEYGGVAGLVTVEDLVEEIVGEIADEHETDPNDVEALSGGGYRVAGRTDLDILGGWVGLEIESTYETISGLICGELGYVPKSGEQFSFQGLDLRIESANERRVTLVTVRRSEDGVGEVAS